MLTGTHVKIAKYIYHILKKEYGIYLSKSNLIYGSIKPDFMKNKVPHYIDKSIDYIGEEIEKLINEFEMISKKAFSRKLGMIMHYISDYFCRAHNTEYYRKNIIAHLKYEKSLGRIVTLKELLKKEICEKKVGNIKDFLIELNKEYMNKKGLKRDVEYSVIALESVINYVVSEIREIGVSNVKIA